MYAVEFEADTDEGIIRIPPEHPELMAKHLKIIVIECGALNGKQCLPAGFQNPVSISSYGELAKRDDIYDR